MVKVSIPIAAVAGAAVVLAPASAWAEAAQTEPYRYEWGPHMMWWDGGYGMIFGPLFMILLLALLVVAVVLLVRWLGGTAPPSASPTRTPLDILKERFARGEIDKTEFEERRRVLSE